jgi:hypothetical protein
LTEAPRAPEPFSRRDREQLPAVLLHFQQVAFVGAVLDLAADALPILLEGVVALNDRLQLEALGRVADLFPAQHVDAAIHVFTSDLRLDFFEAHEVLLVQRAQSLEPQLQLFQRYIELGGLHGSPSARQRLDDQVVEADGGFPVIEGEVVVTSTLQGLGIGEAQHLHVIDPKAYRASIRPFHFQAVAVSGQGGLLPRIIAARLDHYLGAVGCVLVHAGQYMVAVFPTAEDG